ncbi:DUF3662 and FHA domain-containing protein [Corynebacterium sp. CCM 9204]|uniref:DUF3662 and FHA domain-containing protein n=1 Tax=Corynebacterium sp. CCM 9204 TaxID=3057616 RepID=UPI00352447AD
MSVMDRIAKLDSSLQRGLDNGFAFVFGGKVVPGEIDDLIIQQAEDNLSRGDGDWIEAPNVYLVSVSGKDFDNLRSTHPGLPRDAASRMSRWCRNQGFVTLGPVIVQVRKDTNLRTGQLGSRSSIDPHPSEATAFIDGDSDTGTDGDQLPVVREQVQGLSGNPESPELGTPVTPRPAASGYGPEPVPPVSPTPSPTVARRRVVDSAGTTEYLPTGGGPVQHAPLVSLLLQDGSSRTYLVQEGSNIIGRGTDVDFRLPDMGVSRRHAEVMWDGRDAVLVDLHSTNGTTVNDMTIENWLLADGDVIKVGHSYIEVRITGG